MTIISDAHDRHDMFKVQAIAQSRRIKPGSVTFDTGLRFFGLPRGFEPSLLILCFDDESVALPSDPSVLVFLLGVPMTSAESTPFFIRFQRRFLAASAFSPSCDQPKGVLTFDLKGASLG
jgi:hypothetical protein